MTVDLSLGLAKFEADSGRAAQIVVRDQDAMSRAARGFQSALERQAAAAGKNSLELQAIKAATLGLGDSTLALIDKVNGGGSAFASIGAAGVGALGSISAAAAGATNQTSTLLTNMVSKIREVNAQASALKSSAIAQNAAGVLPDSDLKQRLAAIATLRDAELQRLNAAFTADKAAAAAAAQDVADSQARAAAARKIIDQQNGLTATYRTQLQALRDLRDAGNLSPAQFKTASTDLLAQQPITKQRAAAAAAAKAAGDAEAAAAKVGGEAAALSTVQIQSLTHSVRAFFDQVAAGGSPIRAFAVETSKLSGTFGAGTDGIKTLLGLFTPFRIAVGGTVGAVGALGYAFYQGSQQSKAFADSIVLTGNYVGITEGQFNQLAKTVSASGQISISAAREFGQALVSTGQIGAQVFSAAQEAAARYGAATKQNASEVAKDFAGMEANVVAWATEHNKQLNFITAKQYDQIKAFQESGDAVRAQGLVYDALNERLAKLEPNLGLLDKAIRAVTNTWHLFWDAAFDIGRPETIEDKIAKTKAALASVGSFNLFPNTDSLTGESGGSTDAGKSRAELAAELISQSRQKVRQDDNAAADADRAAVNKRAIASRDLIDQYAKEGKSSDLYREKLKALQASFRDNAEAGTPISAAKQAAALKGLADQFADKHGIGEADAQRKALLEQDLKYLQENLSKQQDALKFNQEFLEGVYAASGVSLKAYFDQRAKITAEGVQDELNTLTDQQARLEVELAKGAFKDPHEKIQVQTQLNEAIAKYAKVQTDADHAAVLSAQQRTAAEKALGDSVAEYRAQLLQAQGDEKGAADIRTRLAIANAKLLQTRAGDAFPGVDIATQQKVLELTNALAEAQRRVGQATADEQRAEEAYAIIASRTGANLYAQDAAVYALRVRLSEQLQRNVEATQAALASERDLAAASGRAVNPAVLAAAADAALQYAKALETIDPALNRLRDGVKSVADGITDDIGNAINNFKGFGDLFKSLGKTIQAEGTKFFVTDPLKVQLEGVFKGVSEGDNPIGNFLKGAAGVKVGADGLPAQTAAVAASTSALNALAQAASGATLAFGGKPATATGPLPGLAGKPDDGGSTTGIAEAGGLAAKDLGGYFDAPASASTDLTKSLKSTTSGLGAAAGVLDLFKTATSGAGSAIALLPRVLQTVMSALSSSSSGSNSGSAIGGIGSWFTGLFGGSSANGAAASSTLGNDIALAFHTGGVVGSSGGAARSVSASLFGPGATRYHTGGIAGLAPDEVPAILKRREEVLTQSDPRHRDNAGRVNSRAQKQELHVHVTPPPGASRDSAIQQGKDIGFGIQRAMRRKG